MTGSALQPHTPLVRQADDHDLPPDAAQTLEDLHRAAQRENTVKAYASGLRYWIAWHQARFGNVLPIARDNGRSPVPLATVRTFIADHSVPKDGMHMAMPADVHAAMLRFLGTAARRKDAEARKPLKWATIKLRLEALAYAHRVYDLPFDMRRGRIKEDLKALRASLDRRGLVAPQRAVPLRRRELRALLGACDLATPIGLRDRAMFLFGWARRPSETVGALLADLVREDLGRWCFTLRKAKNLEAGDERRLYHEGTTADALDSWMACRADLPGAADNPFVFPTLLPPSRNDRRWRVAERGLSYKAYARCMKRYATAAGLTAPAGRRMTLQGLRRGFVSESDGRLTLAQTQAITLHQSTRMIVEVYTEQAGQANPGAALFDLDEAG